TLRRAMYGRALDLCTGSGCVAIAFSKHRPTWRVTGVDVSPDALELARTNALRLGAIWGLRFLAGDLFAPLGTGARFELVTANPPYIPSAEIAALDVSIREFEPRIALEGGLDGLATVRRIVDSASQHLVAGGVLAVEVAAGQTPSVHELFERAGFVEI